MVRHADEVVSVAGDDGAVIGDQGPPHVGGILWPEAAEAHGGQPGHGRPVGIDGGRNVSVFNASTTRSKVSQPTSDRI